MSDYFDQLEREVRHAVRAQTHLRWYTRFRLRHTRALIASLAVLVVATPAVAAVAGVFGPGRPDPFYRQAKTSGGGQAIAGTRILPIRVADPDGGPEWGMRLVKTTRDDTCVQVGRVDYGQLGSLGIDFSWDNDHRFHAINPNDGPADICGATDSSGHGFVSADWDETASAYTPSDDVNAGSPAASYCQTDPLAQLKAMLNRLPRGSRSRANVEARLKRLQAALAHVHQCPAGSGRMIFVGLLGPDAKSITYTTPGGAIKTEDTVGGVGAYLIVVKETAATCAFYGRSLTDNDDDCQPDGGTEYPALRLPNAVTSVTYTNGRTCSAQPSTRSVQLFRQYQAEFDAHRSDNAKQAQARFARFLAAHHLSARQWGRAIMPQCPLVGFTTPQQAKVTAAQVASPITFHVVEAKRFCTNGPSGSAYDGRIIACPGAVPAGYRRFNYQPPGQPLTEQALVTASFTARQPVTTLNSFYEWQINSPGNTGGEGSQTGADVRRGQRITFTLFEPANRTGTYHGTISYMQNAGRNGPGDADAPGLDGSVVVGRFRFTLPIRASGSRG